MALIKSISGIRGTIGGKPGEGLSPLDIVKFSAAYGQWVLDTSQIPKVVIGRDARISGSMVSQLVSATLQGMGIHVIDLGLSTTPTVELAVPWENAGGGIIITASHNPIQWNALKLLNQHGEFINFEEGEKVLQIAEKEEFSFATVKKLGSYTLREDYFDKHIAHVLNLELVDKEAIAARNFKVVIDCVNSTGGIVIPKLLKALGVETVEGLFTKADGNFAHNPEPLPEHLRDISQKLQNGSYDLGIVVDPDVDRLALLNEDGSFFGEEYTLVAVADYVLSHKTGNTVSNLSSTRALKDVTLKRGGNYFASAVGEVNVVDKMKEMEAVIGGEGNGGVIYPDSHYGRDALVGIGLFLTHLAKFGKTISRLRATYPNYHISKNKIELTPQIDVDHILEEIKNKYSKHPINDVDGVKIEFEKEWVHLRKSNTEPIIRIYSESETSVTADHLANKLISDIKEIVSSVK
ncbi:phosphoglucosamine mutase [Pleomorphovibrio marinus]|uniref:phosphoglucosamine mutase n=1 Tax=Pleomorphovibrio marinus TaxID=2164132 RepID=UPI000E0A9877|nr:phosphoglucosamine mutase [Pleomorphovibrio marinus]